MKAFWIFLTLSIFYSAVAAPVAVEEIVKVPSNPVEVSKDGVGTWEKRMGPNDKGQSSTTDVQLPDGGTPGGVQGVDAKGVEEKGMSGLAFPWSTDDFGTGGWGPGEEASYNTPPKNPSKEGPDGPEPEPPKSKLMSFLKKISEHEDPTWYFKPRNFGSGDVGTPKRKSHGTVDTKSYVSDSSLLQTTQVTNILTLSSAVRARATSANSIHDLPIRVHADP
jgi:hypothetical protein